MSIIASETKPGYFNIDKRMARDFTKMTQAEIIQAEIEDLVLIQDFFDFVETSDRSKFASANQASTIVDLLNKFNCADDKPDYERKMHQATLEEALVRNDPQYLIHVLELLSGFAYPNAQNENVARALILEAFSAYVNAAKKGDESSRLNAKMAIMKFYPPYMKYLHLKASVPR
ncbi:MAG: hypothetical protein M1561_01150 [Gammaproteobacteria bacterium]|nr:hypothetical protein [Gammaproteobacteria bacterium]